MGKGEIDTKIAETNIDITMGDEVKKMGLDGIETKKLQMPLQIDDIENSGLFSGYASVFDVVDNHNDMIIEGAFESVFSGNNLTNVKLLWQHRPDEPIGIITKINEDKNGLYVEGKLLLDVERAKEAYTLLKSGAINGLSIGYNVTDFDVDGKSGVRIIKGINLFEISLVTFPANSLASVTDVKNSLPKTVREFENFLREAGYSRKQSKSISGYGFVIADNRSQRDVEYMKLDKAIDKAAGVLVE